MHLAGLDNWYEVSTSLLEIEGEAPGTIYVFRDITERKQHEEALREREERFRTMTESSPDAIITLDSSGKFLYCNKPVERIYGYTAEEIVGKSLEVLEPSAMRPIYRKRRGSLLKEALKEERKEVNEPFKDERPFFMTCDKKTEKWILNIIDPTTKQVVEQRINVNGGWRKMDGRR